VKTGISVIEFGLVGIAALNSVSMGYHLSFQTVALITTYLGRYGYTLEAFSPLLWVFCSVPIHVLGLLIARFYSVPPPASAKPTSNVHLRARTINHLKAWISWETTPCAYSEHVPLTDRIKPSYWLLVLQWAIKICVWAQVLYGVFVLSSTLFISLWRSLEVVGKSRLPRHSHTWSSLLNHTSRSHFKGEHWTDFPKAIHSDHTITSTWSVRKLSMLERSL
jgi:hypothetical protein